VGWGILAGVGDRGIRIVWMEGCAGKGGVGRV
jgi:hypothetical protein